MATFTDAKYESNDGKVYQIRLRPETLAAAGTQPTGGVTEDVKAKVSKTGGEFGIRPRFVVGSRKVGTAPDDFRVYTKVPVLTLTEFNSNTYALGASISVGVNIFQIISKQGEDY